MPSYVLSETDRAALAEMLGWWRNQSVNATGRPGDTLDREEMSAAEVYVAKVPTGGIPAMASSVPGAAKCNIYRKMSSGELRPIDKAILVHNLTASEVPEDSWAMVKRDKWGTWFVEYSSSAGVAADAAYTIGQDTLPAYTITADNVWQDTGHTITIPETGKYLLRYESLFRLKVTGGTGGSWVGLRVTDNAGTPIKGMWSIIATMGTAGIDYFLSGGITAQVTITGGTVLKGQAYRTGPNGGTWTTSQMYGAPSTHGHISLGYTLVS